MAAGKKQETLEGRTIKAKIFCLPPLMLSNAAPSYLASEALNLKKSRMQAVETANLARTYGS
ncbi:hypothetical protein BTJ39_11260 [Izhakiella australiensis]|uniref:Uncharacterized protein n=1 Tax=Izhakiella australiensis TaxID=1926881 RepID=A0A1S8YMH3_9GAMM|nr:hypothetical protein BTJ39_11260 [Izhakiella australiensis]